MSRLPSIVAIFVCLWMTVSCLTDRGSIKINGGATTAHIAGGNCGVSVSGNAVTLSQSCAPRVYLMKDASTYYKLPNLLGKSIQFTVNIAQTTCGCNAALYLIQVPSSTTGGDYYCDAQCPNSQCCNEIDIFEANTHAFQGTPHCGDGTNPCKWGCAINWKSANGFGVGGSIINTASSFTVAMSFVQSGSSLSSIKIKLSQSGRSLGKTLTDSSCSSLKSSYISGLTSAVTSGNLIMAISYWGGDMNWLDGCSSGGSCPTSTSVTFSDIQILSSVVALEGDTGTIDSGFVGTPGFYAVIALCVLVGLMIIIGALFVIKKRNTHETV